MIVNENHIDRSLHDRRVITGYNNYLTNHIDNVRKAYERFVKPVLISNYNLSNEDLHEIDNEISNHDKSKWSNEEYKAYANHFYPPRENLELKEDTPEYQMAWLHHQKNNPHHWQYWILIKDSLDIIPLDIPFKCIIGMLCDWSSFQFIRNNCGANKWYSENGKQMLLSKNTRKEVEKLLELCPEL